MAASANYAWANRQLIMHGARKAWSSVLGRSGGSLSLLYDVAHNIAKIEEHDVDNKKEKVIMHRKGATRAFGPGHDELAEEYREVGQPVIIPGSMGTASYVLVGTEKAMQSTFGSTCHGAGRAMSRKAAMKNVQGEKLKNELKSKGIRIEAGSLKGLVEEAPQAYKDIEAVIQVVDKAGIATKVARVRPLAVIKG
jgi:tRNA-splicing ligase RtcB